MPDHFHHFVELPSVAQNGGYYKHKGDGSTELDKLRVFSTLYCLHCAMTVEVLAKNLQPMLEQVH